MRNYVSKLNLLVLASFLFIVLATLVFLRLFWARGEQAIAYIDPGAGTNWSSGRVTDNQTFPGIVVFAFSLHLLMFIAGLSHYFKNYFIEKSGQPQLKGFMIVFILAFFIQWKILVPNLAVMLFLLPTAAILTIITFKSAGVSAKSLFSYITTNNFLLKDSGCPAKILIIGPPLAGIIFGGLCYFLMQKAPGSPLFGFIVGASWPLATLSIPMVNTEK